ncbi:MAG: hypothetical protein KDA54_04865 [Phycisphaerales bacterium]|nr:hypothetical protein [Phycisphaerales bacterium]
MIKVRRKIEFKTRDHGRQVITKASPHAAQVPTGRTPRISRLMALAIHFDRLIRDGAVKDISELAQLAHVTQPRMTQIMNLNHLAPDIQKTLLLLPPVIRDRDPIHERILRPIVAEADWSVQRAKWLQLYRSRAR